MYFCVRSQFLYCSSLPHEKIIIMNLLTVIIHCLFTQIVDSLVLLGDVSPKSCQDVISLLQYNWICHLFCQFIYLLNFQCCHVSVCVPVCMYHVALEKLLSIKQSAAVTKPYLIFHCLHCFHHSTYFHWLSVSQTKVVKCAENTHVHFVQTIWAI